MANVRFKRGDLCPCGSGRPVESCCLRPDGSLIPQARRTEPAPPKTGYSHPHCYAAALCDCSQQISKEHYVSKNILDQLNDDGSLSVSGFPWQQTATPLPVSPKALTAGVLCTRHNSAFSPLDEIAYSFFATLDRMNREFGECRKRGESWRVLFNGHDIERWMLKVLCGLLSSGNLRKRHGDVAANAPPRKWLRMLLGSLTLPAHWGLYFHGEEGYRFEAERGLRLAAFFRDEQPAGLLLSLNAFMFALNMGFPPEAIPTAFSKHALHRVTCLAITNDVAEKTVLFGWDRPGTEKGLKIRFQAREP